MALSGGGALVDVAAQAMAGRQVIARATAKRCIKANNAVFVVGVESGAKFQIRSTKFETNLKIQNSNFQNLKDKLRVSSLTGEPILRLSPLRAGRRHNDSG